MSVLVKGMEMPLSCETCEYKLCIWLMYQKDQVDEIIQEEQARSYGLSRKDDCPYVEVPDGHGRLIDTDAQLEKLDHCLFPSDMATTIAVSMHREWINGAPTVIPSDKEKCGA